MAISRRKTRKPHAGHRLIEGTLSTPCLEFDLGQEIVRQRKEDAWRQEAGRSSTTLVKHADLRVVLISMKANTRMNEHQAAARISMQTISGHVRVHLPRHTVDLPAGRLVVLDQRLHHDVEALENSAFLLTLCWPASAKASRHKSAPAKRARSRRRRR